MFRLSQLLNDPIIFILELYFTGLVFSTYSAKKKFAILKALIFFLLMLLVPVLFHNSSDFTQMMGITLCVLFLFFLMGFFVLDCSFNMKLVLIITSIATQHLCVAFGDIALLFLGLDRLTVPGAIMSGFTFLSVLIISNCLANHQLRYQADNQVKSIRLIMVAFGVIVFAYVLRTIMIIRIGLYNDDPVMRFCQYIYSIMGAVLTYLILFFLDNQDHLQREKIMIEQIMHEREQQQKFHSETIELMNLKYHDMKHQIARFRVGKSDPSSEHFLNNLENTLSSYASYHHSSNTALDAILTEKEIYCQAHNIVLNCMINGKLLNFIPETDIYSLFGNILENAVEAVMELPPENRLIVLQVFERSGYICIHQENACKNTLQLIDGIPKTSKRDTAYHGYGIRSIRYISEKFHGNMTITGKGNTFHLDILIPVKNACK